MLSKQVQPDSIYLYIGCELNIGSHQTFLYAAALERARRRRCARLRCGSFLAKGFGDDVGVGIGGGV